MLVDRLSVPATVTLACITASAREPCSFALLRHGLAARSRRRPRGQRPPRRRRLHRARQRGRATECEADFTQTGLTLSVLHAMAEEFPFTFWPEGIAGIRELLATEEPASAARAGSREVCERWEDPRSSLMFLISPLVPRRFLLG